MRPIFDRIFIVGVGLLGSSIGLNATKKRLGRRVLGVDRDRRNLAVAKRRKAIDQALWIKTPKDLLQQRLTPADLVILATPVQEIGRYLRLLPRGPLVTDVGSTKTSLVRLAQGRHLRYVGSHPIAGTEESGASAGDRNLFRDRICLLVPSRISNPADIKRLRRMWGAMGSRVIGMGPERHDRIFSVVSHLPHTLAYSLAAAVGGLASRSDLARFGFSSLRDATRVAASSPTLWADIFLENRGEVLRSLEAFKVHLRRLEGLIRGKKRQRLLSWLSAAREIRQGIERIFCFDKRWDHQ